MKNKKEGSSFSSSGNLRNKNEGSYFPTSGSSTNKIEGNSFSTSGSLRNKIEGNSFSTSGSLKYKKEGNLVFNSGGLKNKKEGSSFSTNENLNNKTKHEEIKKAKIETFDWKRSNPNIKGKNTYTSNSYNSKPNIFNRNEYSSLYSESNKKLKNSNPNDMIIEEESCNSHYGHLDSKDSVKESQFGKKNSINSFVNRRKSVLFENRSSLKEFQDSISNESSGQTLTNDDLSVSSKSGRSSLSSIATNKIEFSSSSESLIKNKRLEEKPSVESLKNKLNDIYNNDKPSNTNLFLNSNSNIKKPNYTIKHEIEKNDKDIDQKKNSNNSSELGLKENKKINDLISNIESNNKNTYLKAGSSDSTKIVNEPTTPKSKPDYLHKLDKSPGSSEIERLKMIFMNCTQKLQNSEDITNDISAFYKELSKLENVLESSPSRKKNKDDNINKPVRRSSSKILSKPVIPPPPPPPPPLLFASSKTSHLEDVLAYNKNSLKTKKKQIINKDLVPNSNFMDQLIEEFKSKAKKNKKTDVKVK